MLRELIRAVKVAVFLAFFFFLTLRISAQKAIYTIEDCIDIALKNNENIKTAHLNIEYQKQYKKASTEIPKTSFMYTQGQFNSIYKYDNIFAVTQVIPFPTVFSSHAAVANAQIKGSEYKFAATRSDLIYQIKVCYYSLLFLNAKHELLHREDSLYEDFANNSALKYASGKGTLLEKITSETQVMEIRNQLLESEEDINNYEIQLRTLMHAKQNFDIKWTDIKKNYLNWSVDTAAILDHPLLKFYRQQVEVSKKQVKLEAAKILPDLTVGYFNQSIYGPANVFGEDYFLTRQNRLQGFQMGIAVPLWLYPQRSKILAANINTKFAQSDYDYNVSLMEGQYDQAVSQYMKYRNSVNYYQSNALANSKLIIEEALKSYNLKEISYVEYLQVVSQALSIESNLVNVIHQNNMAVLKIEYLLSK
ncbi:MAG: TolC family protein [Bacteroidia bacterium]